MPINKSALIRYKAIDACLRNRTKKWTLEMLIEKVSAAIDASTDYGPGVSKRTVQLDLQHMRSEQLYAAPIEVVDKKYYRYAEPDFSIEKSKLSTAEQQTMQEVVSILRQLNGFHRLGELSETILKLDTALQQSTEGEGEPWVQFESNPMLKGLEYIEQLYDAIRQKKALAILYKSFKARREITEEVFYPHLLKEYRNRWFLIVTRKAITERLLTLALDRIESLRVLEFEPYVPVEHVDLSTYYLDCLGVTKSENTKPARVVLEVFEPHRPYILTKPLHSSQRVVSTEGNSTKIELHVVLNFELEREILGYGPGIKVHLPRILAKRIHWAVEQMVGMYRDGIG